MYNFEEVSFTDIPKNLIGVRHFDLAYAVPCEAFPNPDFTAISPLALHDIVDGSVYLVGSYSPSNLTARMQLMSKDRDLRISEQVDFDLACKSFFNLSALMHSVCGEGGPCVGSTHPKLVKLTNVRVNVPNHRKSMVTNKKVFIVKDSFHQETLKQLMLELGCYGDDEYRHKVKEDLAVATLYAIKGHVIRSMINDDVV